jgi:hypothetical protein
MPDLHGSSLVDLDEPATWPPVVTERVEEWAAALGGTTNFASDLGLPFEGEPEFRRLLDGYSLRAYHCTHLFDHEIESIRSRGLLPLSPDLLLARFHQAVVYGHIGSAEKELLEASNIFACRDPTTTDRSGTVHLVMGRRAFDHDPGGYRPQLSTWGGEGVYKADSPDWKNLRSRLEALGQPTVVEVSIGGQQQWRTHPDLRKLFVGTTLNLKDAFGDVVLNEKVWAECVLSFWQPGHPEYDRHTGLPR